MESTCNLINTIGNVSAFIYHLIHNFKLVCEFIKIISVNACL